MTQRSLVVVGRNGQLGRCLCELAALHGIPTVALGRLELDLATHNGVEKVLASLAPSVIVNTAAYTKVDQAESEAAQAFSINRDGAAALADIAWKLNAPLIHISTDYIFDGSKIGAYDESDIPAPLNVYGASKLAGEAAVLATHPLATVIRSAWVYSPYGTNFVKTMLRQCETRPVVKVVHDQRGNPTSAFDLAAAILHIAERSLMDDRRATAGIFHLTGEGEASWHGFAEAIFDGLSRRGMQIPRLEAVPTENYVTPARRPRNSCLNSARAERVFGIRLASWRASLEVCLDQLVKQAEADGEIECVGRRQLSDHMPDGKGFAAHA